jgi:formylglycine-generating enzyme required for sulfatase activity
MCASVTLTLLLFGCRSTPSAEQSATESAPQAPVVDVAPPAPAPFTIVVPGTTARLTLVPVPGGTVADPTTGERTHVDPFWIATTEITWDMYDAFVFALDRSETETDPPDAWARPSKPYILMDRGFGHAGYPAISVSHKGATEFCKWLSARTHGSFTVPTEAEWELACRAGGTDATNLGDRAWFADNSEVDMRISTHPVAQKRADALGLFDMLGNAAEWTTDADGKGVARGGSFKDAAAKLTCSTRRPDDRALNASDPQIPKSVWWLADGGFIGFRVVARSLVH